jgi:hypothetical protein
MAKSRNGPAKMSTKPLTAADFKKQKPEGKEKPNKAKLLTPDTEGMKERKNKPSLKRIMALMQKGRVDLAMESMEILMQMKEKGKRGPTAYNLFMKEHITKLKEKDPNMDHKERLALVAQMWNEQKATESNTDSMDTDDSD